MMNTDNEIITNTESGRPPQYGTYIFLAVCIWTLTFEEPVTHLGPPVITLFRNALPLLAIAYFILSEPRKLHALTRPVTVLGFVFAASGMIGWAMHEYQSFSTTFQALYEHIRFWICLWAFFALLTSFPLKTYARRLFFHVGTLAALFTVLSVIDMIFRIWPRQIYRFGVGSIQLFFGHPSNYGAHVVFLLMMLCILIPYLKDDDGRRTRPYIIASVLAVFMLFLTAATLRVRLIGFIAVFAVLFFFMFIMKKKLNPGILALGLLVAIVIGANRIHAFFVSKYAFTMARGQFMTNGLSIARDNFPFGAGFGTFGSRMAQIHYSPLYYKYHMMTTPGMAPSRPSYACDSFYPMLLGESGWLGTASYIGMIVLLFVIIFSMQKTAVLSPYAGGISAGTAGMDPLVQSAVFSSVMLLIYELSETTGTIAFSETYSVMIALALGLAMGQLHASALRFMSLPR